MIPGHVAPSWLETTIGLPADRPEDWLTEYYRFAPRAIRLMRPRDPDRLLDDPAVQRASRANDYMPYWAYVWPGAILLAERVLAEAWSDGLRAVELGCGLGLAGLAGLAAGLHVTFTDYSPAALALASHNARLNGFDYFETRLLNWQEPSGETFDVVLGADVLYEPRCLPDVLRVLDNTLASNGVALLSDPNRAVADPFNELARHRGYAVQCEPAVSRSQPGQVLSGRIFHLWKSTPVRGNFLQ